MELFQGAVLLDNTTIYGAKYAYESWPPKKEDWLNGPNSVNIRSLMDLLESLVLHETLIADSSSRHPDVIIWDDLQDLEQRQEGNLVRIFENVYFAQDKKLTSALIGIALEKLQVYLGDGTFSRGLEQFRRYNSELVLPAFYTSPRDFSEVLSHSFSYSLSSEVEHQIGKVEIALQASDSSVANYAMFAFRGFYYQQLAHCYSISYTPHTWRSDLVENDINKSTVDFAKYISHEAKQIRQEVNRKLSHEFNTRAFNSDFPVFASYIAHQSTSRSQLFPTALQIRNSSPVKAFRRWVSNIQEDIENQSDLPKILRAQTELETIIMDLRKEFGLSTSTKAETEPITIKFGIPIGSLEVGVPISTSLLIPAWLQRILHRRTHLIFLRDILEKSVSLAPFTTRFYQLKP